MLLYPVPLVKIRPYIDVPPFSSREDFDYDQILSWSRYCFRRNEVIFDKDLKEFINNVDLDYFFSPGSWRNFQPGGFNNDVFLQEPILLTYNLKYKDDDEILQDPLACIDFRQDIDRVLFLSTASFIEERRGTRYDGMNIQLLLVPIGMKQTLLDYLIESLWEPLSIVNKQGDKMRSGKFVFSIDEREKCRYMKHDGDDNDFYGNKLDYRDHTTCYHKSIFTPFKNFFKTLIKFAKSKQIVDSLFNLSKETIKNNIVSQMSVSQKSSCPSTIFKMSLKSKIDRLKLPEPVRRKIQQDIDFEYSNDTDWYTSLKHHF